MYIYIYVYVINSMILGTVIIMIMNQFTSGNDGFPFSDKPNRTLLQHSHGCLALDVMFCPNLEPRGHQKKKTPLQNMSSIMFPYGNLLPGFKVSNLLHLCTWVPFFGSSRHVQKKYEFQSLKAVII